MCYYTFSDEVMGGWKLPNRSGENLEVVFDEFPDCRGAHRVGGDLLKFLGSRGPSEGKDVNGSLSFPNFSICSNSSA